MKQLNMTRILLFLLFSMVGHSASAHDIAVVNAGKIIYYKWTKNNTELAVSFQGTDASENEDEYYGDVVIPEYVMYNDVSYPVTNIDFSAFYGCSRLTSVTIPNSLKGIGWNAFYDCTSLTSIVIPNSVTYIGNDAFTGTAWYSNQPDGMVYAGKVLYSYKGTISENTSISLPEGTVGIASYAFHNCSGLTNVVIPNSVTYIGNDAFTGTAWYSNQPDGLVYAGKVAYTYKGTMPVNTSISLQEGTVGIASSAFLTCSGLTNVVIPNSVTNIGDLSFFSCSDLRSVTIPSSVTSIGYGAFASCSNLTDVYCYSENVPTTLTDLQFYKTPISSATLYVPATSIDTYSNTAPWSGFGNIVAIEPLQKCSTPTISFTNGRLQFGCETEGVEFVPSISLIDAEMESNDKVDLFSVYRFNVYAKKEGYADSDVATMDIDFNRLNGDMNHDGQISIADATAIVNIILNDITVIDPEQKFYYSVGTEKVTRTNYTTINNAQYKLEFSEIPEELDLSAISQQQAVILLPEGCMPMIRSASGLVGTTSVSLGNGYMVYTTTAAINGSECTCTVYK